MTAAVLFPPPSNKFYYLNNSFKILKIYTDTIKIMIPGLDINVCPIPKKTDVGKVDLVLRLSDGTREKIGDSQTCRYDGQIYFHWYKILGLLYKRALFDLQFVHFYFIKTKEKRQIKTLLLYHLSFLHMKFKDIDKIKVAISETL